MVIGVVVTLGLCVVVSLLLVVRTVLSVYLHRSGVYIRMRRELDPLLVADRRLQESGNLLSFADSALQEKTLLLNNIIDVEAFARSGKDSEGEKKAEKRLEEYSRRLRELDEEIDRGKSRIALLGVGPGSDGENKDL